MNDLPTSQQLPTSDATPGRDTGVLGRNWQSLLEAAEKEVSRSFLCLVRRESVSHASLTVCLSRGAECVVVSMCGCACVVAYVWF